MPQSESSQDNGPSYEDAVKNALAELRAKAKAQREADLQAAAEKESPTEDAGEAGEEFTPSPTPSPMSSPTASPSESQLFEFKQARKDYEAAVNAAIDSGAQMSDLDALKKKWFQERPILDMNKHRARTNPKWLQDMGSPTPSPTAPVAPIASPTSSPTASPPEEPFGDIGTSQYREPKGSKPALGGLSGVPLIDSKEGYEALAPGALFIDKHDGEKYVKPKGGPAPTATPPGQQYTET